MEINEKALAALNNCLQYPEECRKCPYADKCYTSRGVAEDLLMDSHELLKSLMNGWTSVNDSNPIHAGWYLVYDPSYTGGSSHVKEKHDNVMFSAWNGVTWSVKGVTHWMPLPGAPNTEA